MQKFATTCRRSILISRVGIRTMVYALLLTLVTTQTSIAEDEENNYPPAYQYLKQLEPYVGKWQGEFDPPGDAPKGMVTVTSRWVGNKSYLLTEVIYIPEGTKAELNQQTAIIGYNWKTKSMHAWEFGWVMQSSIPVVATDNQLTMEGGEVFSRHEGRKPKTTTIKLTDANTMVTTSHLINDGKKELHEHLILKRVDEVAP